MGLDLARRTVLRLVFGAAAAALVRPQSADARVTFDQWVETFRARANARGISDATYRRVMTGLKPDTSVYALQRAQPEFTEELWQYLNRRVSDFRVITGKERLKEHAALLARIERDYGVDPTIMVGLWGLESSFGNVIDNPKYMRPIFPALAALAWGEPRRQRYWEQELLNALVIVERGWSQPSAMIGSWAGAMGHTQWMPEVWLHMGVDYDKDGKIFPFGKPDDALAGTARYLAQRGGYRRGEPWGHEVKVPKGLKARRARHTVAQWQKLGVKLAKGGTFPHPEMQARLWIPVSGGPAFLLGKNFSAVRSYNPSDNYTLAICLLADRVRGEGLLVQAFPGGERTLTLPEIQEIQRRLTAAGFKTDGTDGRVGVDTMRAVREFQRKFGIEPADGYPSLKVLTRLRQGV